jgi:hypothetical protein
LNQRLKAIDFYFETSEKDELDTNGTDILFGFYGIPHNGTMESVKNKEYFL